jgi:hypothetical protein
VTFQPGKVRLQIFQEIFALPISQAQLILLLFLSVNKNAKKNSDGFI